MYDTLRADKLTATDKQKEAIKRDPTTVVSWSLFKQNQLPYLEIRRPFILGAGEGRWKPTLGHWVGRLLNDRGMLDTIVTQNIDGLEHQTGIPHSRVVACHGTMGTASCEFCGYEVQSMEWFRGKVRASVKDIHGEDASAPPASSEVKCPRCGEAGLKPDTVLYERSLPEGFFRVLENDIPHFDLLIIAGTSLSVAPANLVPSAVRNDCVRFVANKEPVGQAVGIHYGSSSRRDVSAGEKGCDEAMLDLVEYAGWLDELAKYMGEMAEASQRLLTERLAMRYKRR